MLNQVPRTLLSISGDTNDGEAVSSPCIDWASLTLGAEGKSEAGGLPPGMITPHSNAIGDGRGGHGSFFPEAQHSVPPPPPAAPAGRSRGAGVERRRKAEDGRGMGSMAAFTNDSIADQALKDFGSGDVSGAVRGSTL